MPRAERDWSSLRGGREWQPVGTNSAGGAAASKEAAASGASADGSPAAGAAGSTANAGASEDSGGKSLSSASPSGGGKSAAWITDKEISARNKGGGKGGYERTLQRWNDPDSEGLGALGGGLLEAPGKKKGNQEKWDQFKVNEQLFGYVSTYKEDLSQYTTPLEPHKLSTTVKRQAERIAREIESGSYATRAPDDGHGIDFDGADDDEEALFASVPRGPGGDDYWRGGGWGCGWTGEDAEWGTEDHYDASCAAGASDGGAAGAIMALIAPSAGSGGAGSAGGGGTGGNAPGGRGQVVNEVQNWWRERRQSGAAVPTGAEDGVVCPFSERVFGDLTQLVAHWSTAIPRGSESGDDADGATRAVSTQFRKAAQEATWAEMAPRTGLDEVLSVSTPRPGSVWEQVLTNVRKQAGLSPKEGASDDASSAESLTQRPFQDFVAAAVQIRCWRREQKVEHREVLEGFAINLALALLAKHPGSGTVPWANKA